MKPFYHIARVLIASAALAWSSSSGFAAAAHPSKAPPLVAAPLPASTRASANYSVAAETTDSGGQAATSANYSQQASLGAVAGVSKVSAPVPEVAKAGYLGEIYEIVGFVLNAPARSIIENATLPLSGGQLLDDATTLAVPASAVTWSVDSGPLVSIDAGGLATAGTVYQDTAATARGIYKGVAATFSLTVINTNTDDYGAYAGDGIDDAWQVRYFGAPPNAAAAPDVDADGTGQSNLFKYLAGLNPLDPASRFVLKIGPVAGQPGQMSLTFSPRYDGRAYTVQSTTDLTRPSWSAVANFTTTDNGDTRTVTDLNAGSAPRFYRVQISAP